MLVSQKPGARSLAGAFHDDITALTGHQGKRNTRGKAWFLPDLAHRKVEVDTATVCAARPEGYRRAQRSFPTQLWRRFLLLVS
jgi:hypothetical protein